jgi:hypothetical protein
MKFLSGLIEPRYLICSSTRLQLICRTTPSCAGEGNGKGYFQTLVDSRDGTVCREILEHCDC